jgi:arabinofuranosyltransferase
LSIGPPEDATPYGLLQLSLLAGLIAVNRMDLILLVGPALAHAFWRVASCHSARRPISHSRRSRPPRASEANRGEESGRSSLLRETRAKRAAKVAGLVLLGFAPFIAWEIFSIIYYGFPFPNTAYAKLNTGVPAGQLMRHGLDYLLDSLQADPLTLPAIGAAAAAALIWRDPRHIAIAAGIVLYLLYVVRIGGDFMSGRFLSVPLMFALGVLASVPAKLSSALWLSGALLAACAGLAGPRPSVLSTSVYGLCWTFPTEREPIVDERAFYYPETGLLRDRRGLPAGIERFKEAARQLKGRSSQVSGSATIGVYGYYMGKVIGPAAHVIDYYALADPLLARLPMKDDSRWRIGHFTRHVPDGYPERLHSDSNHLSDPNLDAFYDKLCLITRGPLFAWQRWRAIWAMNLGLYDHLIDREFYRHPPERVWLSQVNGGPKPRNVRTELARNADGAFVLPSAGFIVILGATSHATQLEIGLDGRQEYRIDYPQLGRFPVQQRIPAASPQSGQVVRRIDVPPDVAERGFDRFRILPVGGDGPYSLGFVRLVGDKTPTRDGT